MTGIPPHWSHLPTQHAPYPQPSYPSTGSHAPTNAPSDPVVAQPGEQGFHQDQSTSSVPGLTAADRQGTDKLPSPEPSEIIGCGITDALRQAHARLHSDTGTDVDMDGAVGVGEAITSANACAQDGEELGFQVGDCGEEEEEEAQEDWETYVKRRLSAQKSLKSKKLAGDCKDGQPEDVRRQAAGKGSHANRDGGRAEGASHGKRRSATDGQSADGPSKKVSRRRAEVREDIDTAKVCRSPSPKQGYVHRTF